MAKTKMVPPEATNMVPPPDEAEQTDAKNNSEVKNDSDDKDQTSFVDPAIGATKLKGRSVLAKVNMTLSSGKTIRAGEHFELTGDEIEAIQTAHGENSKLIFE